MKIPDPLFLKSLLLALVLPCGVLGATEVSLATDDGLVLRCSEQGRITSVQAGRSGLPTSRSSGGIALRDVLKGGEFVPVFGNVVGARKSVRVRGNAEGLEVQATLTAQGNQIRVEGIVQNPGGGDRCVDLKFYLPIACRDWSWGMDLAGEDLIESKIQGQRTSDHITVYPIAPVSNVRLDAGVSMAIPPTHPTLFETGADQDGLYVLFKIGISEATRPPNATSFKLIIYRHDPAWGFRSSIQRYYDFFRDPYFVRRIKKAGAWGWHHPPPSELPNADLYKFHEAGGETWRIKDEGQHGYEHEGQNLAATVGGFERLGKFAEDEKLGIYSLPYTIVGQRQVYHLAKPPQDRDEALAEFEKWSAPEPMLFQSPGPSVSFRNVDQLKAIIRNSNIYDEQQKPVVLLREYLGNTITFPLNPNPKLFAGLDKVTIAKYTLDDYLPMLFNGSKLIDGCYVDSLGRWPAYYNYRRDHFKYSTVPLTYSGKTPQPCLWNLQSHAEYLWALSERLHAQNKIVFANGVHANRVMLGFAVDALGMEGMPAYDKREGFYSMRVAAGAKPFCALNGHEGNSPKMWNSCLYLGILVGARSKAGQEMERKYLPTIIQLNEAGWEPITYARADDSAVGIERWGGGKGKPVYFSLLNRSKNAATTVIHVEPQALKLGRKATIVDLLSQKTLTNAREHDQLFFELSLAPEQATAVVFR